MPDRQKLSSDNVAFLDPKAFFDHVDKNFRMTDPLPEGDPLLEMIQIPQDGVGLYPVDHFIPIDKTLEVWYLEGSSEE